MAVEIDVLDDDQTARRQGFHGPEKQRFRHGQMRQHEADIDELGSLCRPVLHHAAPVEFDMVDLSASAASRAAASLVSSRSKPITRPSGPTRSASSKLTSPPPQPASITSQPAKWLETIEQSCRGRRQNPRQHRKSRTAFFSALDDIALSSSGFGMVASLKRRRVASFIGGFAGKADCTALGRLCHAAPAQANDPILVGGDRAYRSMKAMAPCGARTLPEVMK